MEQLNSKVRNSKVRNNKVLLLSREARSSGTARSTNRPTKIEMMLTG